MSPLRRDGALNRTPSTSSRPPSTLGSASGRVMTSPRVFSPRVASPLGESLRRRDAATGGSSVSTCGGYAASSVSGTGESSASTCGGYPARKARAFGGPGRPMQHGDRFSLRFCSIDSADLDRIPSRKNTGAIGPDAKPGNALSQNGQTVNKFQDGLEKYGTPIASTETPSCGTPTSQTRGLLEGVMKSGLRVDASRNASSGMSASLAGEAPSSDEAAQLRDRDFRRGGMGRRGHGHEAEREPGHASGNHTPVPYLCLAGDGHTLRLVQSSRRSNVERSASMGVSPAFGQEAQAQPQSPSTSLQLKGSPRQPIHAATQALPGSPRGSTIAVRAAGDSASKASGFWCLKPSASGSPTLVAMGARRLELSKNQSNSIAIASNG